MRRVEVDLWALVKDVVLTGTGVALIISQIFSATPSDALLVTGLALTVPTIAGQAKALLSGGPSGDSKGGEPGSTTPSKPSHSRSSGEPE